MAEVIKPVSGTGDGTATVRTTIDQATEQIVKINPDREVVSRLQEWWASGTLWTNVITIITALPMIFALGEVRAVVPVEWMATIGAACAIINLFVQLFGRPRQINTGNVPTVQPTAPAAQGNG